MKISIDLDGTFFQHLQFYVNLINMFKMTGNTVGIMSCHPPEHYPMITGLDFWYTVKDWSTQIIEADNKADIMIKENIDVSFDDRGLLIYKSCAKMGHSEKICLCNWSHYTENTIEILYGLK